MADKKKQYRVAFDIDKATNDKVKALPRSYNLSEKLRGYLVKLLDAVEKEKAKPKSEKAKE